MHTNPSRGAFEDLFPVSIAHIACHLRGLVEAVYPDATEIRTLIQATVQEWKSALGV